MGEHIWHFFIDVVMLVIHSRFTDNGCQRIPAHEWEAIARLLEFEATSVEWGIVLAMDAKYCEIQNSCMAHNRSREMERQKKK